MFKLRELEESDLEIINRWRNNPELIRNLGAPFRYINYEVDKYWYNNYIKNRSTTIRCSIVNESDDIVGLISLASINQLNQSADLHIMIGEASNQSKGIGTFAVKEILNHAFNNLNLNRVQLQVLEYNKKAIGLYEKLGFKVEGRRRQTVYKDGRFVDMIMYSILRKEYFDEGI